MAQNQGEFPLTKLLQLSNIQKKAPTHFPGAMFTSYGGNLLPENFLLSFLFFLIFTKRFRPTTKNVKS